MAGTLADYLRANGVSAAYAPRLAERIATLDPLVRDRFTQTVVDFYQKYGAQGYDLGITQASRTTAGQKAIQKTGVKSASPMGTWHIGPNGGAAADFAVYKDGVLDEGKTSSDAYMKLLRPIAATNKLVNPIKGDIGHFMPTEVPLARAGRSVADFVKAAPAATAMAFADPKAPSSAGKAIEELQANNAAVPIPRQRPDNTPIPRERPVQVATLQPQVISLGGETEGFKQKLQSGQVAWNELPPEWQQHLSQAIPDAQNAYETARAMPAPARQVSGADPRETMFAGNVPPSGAQVAGIPPEQLDRMRRVATGDYTGERPVLEPGTVAPSANNSRLAAGTRAPQRLSSFVSSDKEGAGLPPQTGQPGIASDQRFPTVSPPPAQVANVPTPPTRPSYGDQADMATKAAVANGMIAPHAPALPRSKVLTPASVTPPRLAAQRAQHPLAALVTTLFKALVPGAKALGSGGPVGAKNGPFGSILGGPSGAYGQTAFAPGAQWHGANFNALQGGSKYNYFTNPTTGTGGYYDNQGELHTYDLSGNPVGY